MKKFLLLVLALVFVVGIISCETTQSSVNTTGKGKVPEECPLKKMGVACTGDGHDGKPCPISEGKGPCDECQEADKKMGTEQGHKHPHEGAGVRTPEMEKDMTEIQKLNDEVINYMGAKQFDKALEISRVLEEKYPPNPIIIYNIACAHSLAGNKKDGVFYIRKSIQYGWSDWKHMDEDTDLDNIRNEVDYKKLREALQLIYPEGAKNPPKCQGKCKEKGASHEQPDKK